MIPPSSKQPHLILHLYGNDRGMILILRFNMFHQFRKRGGVPFHGHLTKRRDCVQFLMASLFSPEIFPAVLLHPPRHIHRFRIFPQPEPQQDKVHVPLFCLFEQTFNNLVLKYTLLRFELLPVNRNYKCVQLQPVYFIPDMPFHIFQTACRRIMYLPGISKEWRTIHIQRRDPV